MALALKDLLNSTSHFSYEYITTNQEKYVRKYGKGQTSSKYKVKVGMLEVAFEGGEWRRKRVTKSNGDGKAQGS